MITPRELYRMFQEGKNVMELLRNDLEINYNTKEIIEIAYDFQSGSYIDLLKIQKNFDHKQAYTQKIADTIMKLCQPTSILEAGVGEATTLAGVVNAMPCEVQVYGFDLSWSRSSYAKMFMRQQCACQATICTGDLFNIPFADDSVDVVYTSHSIEPNGGCELPILQELYRVARKYLVLLEPGYEFACEEGKRRMEKHCYCRNLNDLSLAQGYAVLRHDLFSTGINPLNPTAITIIEKAGADAAPFTGSPLACPRFKTPLVPIETVMYSPEALVAYPVIGGIPCLRIENGVIASKIEELEALRGGRA